MNRVKKIARKYYARRAEAEAAAKKHAAMTTSKAESKKEDHK